MLRYILGQVSPEERAEFEDRYIVDADLFEELLAVESDLIDSYVRGDLQGADRFQFESRFLTTPELRRRVQFAQSLSGYQRAIVSPRPVPRWWNLVAGSSPARRFALAGIILGLLVFTAWTAVGSVRLRRQLEHMNAEQARLQQLQQDALRQITDLKVQLQRLQEGNGNQQLADLGPSGQPLISLTLSPGVPRGSGKATILPISSDVSNVLLLLKTGAGPYSRYGVSVETPEGQQVFKKDGLKVLQTKSGSVVAVSLPARALPRGDYILRLVGTKASGQTEDIDAYSFRVVVH